MMKWSIGPRGVPEFYSRRNSPEPTRVQVPIGHEAAVHDEDGQQIILNEATGHHVNENYSESHLPKGARLREIRPIEPPK